MSLVHYRKYPGIKQLARDLRLNMTPSEKILWEYLRLRRMMGFRFLRQHPVFYRENNNWIDFYIADFYCHELNLIIELDGKMHKKQLEYDIFRDNRLKEKGLRVLRIENDMLDDILNVKERIELEIKNILAENGL